MKVPVHKSDCRLHDGPAKVPGVCSCGADWRMDPISYGSEFPTEAAATAYAFGFKDREFLEFRANGQQGVRPEDY
jgi:hypothetical protein